jgi:DNA-binding CsgD family transcriptional regulator
MFVSERDDQIRQLLENGVSRSEIGRRLRIDRSTVSRIAARVGFPSDARTDSEIDWTTVRVFYDAGWSVEACKKRFGFTSSAWDAAVCRGEVVSRPHPNPGQPAGKTRQRVAVLLRAGRKPAQIARELGVSKPTVSYHVRNLGLPPHEPSTRRFDWAAIKIAYDAGLSMRQCMAEFGFKTAAWAAAVKRGAVTPRPQEMALSELVVVGRRTGRGHLKKRLIKAGLKENHCELCGINEWQGRPLNVALHHINGDGMDNRLENLQLLCPNCHSQTPNYGGRNGHRKPKGVEGVEA